MSLDQTVSELSKRIADQLADQMEALLSEAKATIARLEDELRHEQQRREQIEAQFQELECFWRAMKMELCKERQSREAAVQEVETIHAAIAEQLERAEAEHAANQAAEAERERRWSEQHRVLQEQFSQERFLRERLQQRVENLRNAAADLFATDVQLPGVAIPESESDLLANATRR
jgi:chromosome segregation protein